MHDCHESDCEDLLSERSKKNKAIQVFHREYSQRLSMFTVLSAHTPHWLGITCFCSELEIWRTYEPKNLGDEQWLGPLGVPDKIHYQNPSK